MRFGRWIPLEEAARAAPAGPGIYQIKLAHGLVQYPTGQSAMIQYGVAAEPAHRIAELAAAHPGRPWMCRFAEELTAREAAAPDGIVADLVATFLRRFGSEPTWPDP